MRWIRCLALRLIRLLFRGSRGSFTNNPNLRRSYHRCSGFYSGVVWLPENLLWCHSIKMLLQPKTAQTTSQLDLNTRLLLRLPCSMAPLFPILLMVFPTSQLPFVSNFTIPAATRRHDDDSLARLHACSVLCP